MICLRSSLIKEFFLTSSHIFHFQLAICVPDLIFHRTYKKRLLQHAGLTRGREQIAERDSQSRKESNRSNAAGWIISKRGNSSMKSHREELRLEPRRNRSRPSPIGIFCCWELLLGVLCSRAPPNFRGYTCTTRLRWTQAGVTRPYSWYFNGRDNYPCILMGQQGYQSHWKCPDG